MTDNDSIWIGQDGKKYGPYAEADIRQWLLEGKLDADALAWREGMADWAPLASLLPVTAAGKPPVMPPPFPPANADTPWSSGLPLPPGGVPGRPHDSSADSSAYRASLPSPPTLHWGLVLLFTMFTLGIFGMVWAFVQARWIRKIDQRSNATLQLAIAVACLIVGYPLYLVGIVSGIRSGQIGNMGMASMGGMLLLAQWVLSLVAFFSMASSVKRVLAARGVSLEIGGVTLFFFRLYYLQAVLSWVGHWKQTGRTSPAPSKGVFWAIFLLLPFGIGILAAIAIPAYQDYVIRAQVSEALVLGDGAKTAMAEYYGKMHAFPPDNPSAGLARSTSIAGRYVSSVDVSDDKITVAFETARSNVQIRYDVLVLTPLPGSNGSLSWRCGGAETTVPMKYLPMSCRR